MKKIFLLFILSFLAVVDVCASGLAVPLWSKNAVYHEGDQAVFQDDLYQAKWWTQGDEPSKEASTSSPWQFVRQYISGQIQVAAQIDASSNVAFKPAVHINDEVLPIDFSKETSMRLAKGGYQLFAKNHIEGEYFYQASVMPSKINIQALHEKVPVTVSYQAVVNKKVPVTFAVSGMPGSSSTQVLVRHDQDYFDRSQSIQNGEVSVQVPAHGNYILTFSPVKSSEGAVYATTSTLKVNGGVLVGQALVVFSKQKNEPLTVGYLTSWNKQYKISDVAQKGYNTVVIAFAKVTGSQVDMYDTWNIYADWTKGGRWQENMRADIDDAKAAGNLKHVILSVGGENNTFQPGGAPAEEVAKNIIQYARSLGADGIDFDLENLGAIDPEVFEGCLLDLIQSMHQQDPMFVVTAAPQLNYTEDHQVNPVNTGTQQIFKKAIEVGAFNYIFFQEYNTGHYYMDPQGNAYLADDKPSDAVNQTDPLFIMNSYARLKQVIPATTKIVPGQPSDATAAGDATVYHGKDKAHVYQRLCQMYQALHNDPQYGGAMTWSINQDGVNDFNFLKSITTQDCDSIPN